MVLQKAVFISNSIIKSPYKFSRVEHTEPTAPIKKISKMIDV